MEKFYLSVNQLAEFSDASEAKKRTIINQQKKVNTNKTFWYQTARASIRKSLRNHGDVSPIAQAIESLRLKTVEKPRQENDRTVSIEALQRFLTMRLPQILNGIDYTVIQVEKGTEKSIIINGVNIIVSPDIVFKGMYKGQTIVGAFKIHIKKSKPFDYTKSSYVSTLIYKYLKVHFEREDEIVLPELCFCVDIFSGRFTNTNSTDIARAEADINGICKEIKEIWDAA